MCGVKLKINALTGNHWWFVSVKKRQFYLIGFDFLRVFAKSLDNLSGTHGPPFLITVLIHSNQLLYVCVSVCKVGGLLLKCHFSQVQ